MVFSGSKGAAEAAHRAGQLLAEKRRMDVEVTVDNVNGILAELIEDSSTHTPQEGNKNRNSNRDVSPPPSNLHTPVFSQSPQHTSTPIKKYAKPLNRSSASLSLLQVPQQSMQDNDSMDTSSDNVFKTPHASHAATSLSADSQALPPEYRTIRAARNNSRQGKSLPGNAAIARSQSQPPTCGSFIVQEDYRAENVKKFHIPALKRNTTSSVHREGQGERLLCTACDEKHCIDGTQPLCIVLTDQNFPPCLPVTEGICTVVLRIEDALLSELPDLLAEYFGRGKSCAVPENSAIVFGSISHLAHRGLTNYIEEITRTASTLIGATGGRVNISHYTYTPLGGITDPCLVRDLLDLDSWLSLDHNSNRSLPRARAALWQTILEQNEPKSTSSCDARRYFVPESISNGRKMHFASDKPACALPGQIRAFTTEEESRVITAMLADIETAYGVHTGAPAFDRGCATNETSDSGSKRVVVFGGSHMVRTASKLTSLGVPVESVAVGGWLLNKGTAEGIVSKIRDLDLGLNTAEDVVVIDLLSNAAFAGTNEDGSTLPAQKLSDGTWHIVGDLSPVPPSVLKAKLKNLAGQLPVELNVLWVLICPFPRYISESCCSDPTHCQNRNDTGLKAEIIAATRQCEEILKNFASKEQLNAVIINPCSILNITAENEDLTMEDGQPLWPPGSPVHLRASAYLALAEDILQQVIFGSTSDTSGQAAKRQRLDSVVVREKKAVTALWQISDRDGQRVSYRKATEAAGPA